MRLSTVSDIEHPINAIHVAKDYRGSPHGHYIGSLLYLLLTPTTVKRYTSAFLPHLIRFRLEPFKGTFHIKSLHEKGTNIIDKKVKSLLLVIEKHTE